MKKLFILWISLSIFPSSLAAQNQEQMRRIEEGKRESLRPSEGLDVEERRGATAPIDPNDLLYFIELIPRRIAFRYDASKALVILMGVEKRYIDLDSQITFLEEKNLIPKGFEFDPKRPLRKGLTAYMFCKALEIRGGLILRLFGMNERYALKELVHQRIISPGNVKDIVSGEELVSILTNAGNHIAETRK